MLAADGSMILFSTHRFDMVEKLCSRALILSEGRIVAEHDVSASGAGTATLEDTFCRVTRQADFRPLAREILDTIRA
jgi:ABC-2 type transport system ATP-binding protein